MHSFLLPSPTLTNAFTYFILFSPSLSLEGITPLFVDEGTEAQANLMPIQGLVSGRVCVLIQATQG